jgi:hypothetical protein
MDGQHGANNPKNQGKKGKNGGSEHNHDHDQASLPEAEKSIELGDSAGEPESTPAGD